MKKILTASLVAMMAVTAANANIASTKYVDDRTGNLSGFVQENTNLTTAVNVLAATVSTNAGAASDAADQALADAKAYTDDLANGAVAGNTAAIAGMDLASVGADGSYIKTVSQADGKVTATAEAADAAPTQNSTKMVTSGGVYTAIEAAKTAASGANSELAGRVDANEDAISALNTEQDAQDGKISALETSLASGATKQAIDAAKKAGDDAQADIDAYKTSNDQALAAGLALKEDVANKATTDYASGSTTQYPSVKVAEDIANKAVASTKTDLSTLTQTVTNNKTAAEQALADAKSELQTELETEVGILEQADVDNLAAAKKYADDEDAKIEATIGTVAEGETVVGLIEEAKQAASGANSALAGRVTTAEGKITTIEGQQTTQDTKISALETSLADGGATDKRFDAVEATANAAQVKSTADFQFGGANGTWKDITTLPEYCGKANATCSLVSKNGTIQWELVEY